LKNTGTAWTASAHVITAVIGSGVLSLAWAIAQLGWIAGPIVMILFAWVTYYTSILLCECYRNGDPINGKRNYTYMEVVHSNLGKFFSVNIYKEKPIKKKISLKYLLLFLCLCLFRWFSSHVMWDSSVSQPCWSCHWIHYSLSHKHDVSLIEILFIC